MNHVKRKLDNKNTKFIEWLLWSSFWELGSVSVSHVKISKIFLPNGWCLEAAVAGSIRAVLHLK